MGLFNKKKSDDKGSAKKETKGFGGRGKKKKGQSLNESVPESAFSIMAENEPFIDGDSYIGACLHLDDIPGWGNKNDKEVGQIIEHINSGAISSFIFADLLADGDIIIIPNSDTLAVMEDYTKFTEREYELCRITPDEQMTELQSLQPLGLEKVDFDTLNAICDGSTTLYEVTGGIAGENQQETYEEPVPEPEYDESDEGYNADDNTEDFNDYSTEFGDDDDEEEPVLDEPEEEPDDGELELGYSDDYQQQEENIYENEINDIVTRVMYDEDLRIVISNEPFLQQFGKYDSVPLFDENRHIVSDDESINHLDEMYNLAAHTANEKIKAYHNNQLILLQSTYMDILNLHANKINEYLSYDSETIASAYANIKRANDDREADSQRLIAEKMQEITDEMNDAIDAARAAGAKAYEDAWHRDNDADYNERRRRVEESVNDEIRKKFNQDKLEFDKKRRADASEFMDDAIGEALSLVGQKYKDIIDEERRMYENAEASIIHTINEERDKELARIDTLREELRQRSVADKVAEEKDLALKNLADEYSRTVATMEDSIKAAKESKQAELDKQASMYENQIQKLNNKNSELQNEITNMMAKYANVEDSVNSRYRREIETLMDRENNLQRIIDDNNRNHKHANAITIMLVIAAAISALAIGFISGEYSAVKKSLDMNVPAVTTEQTNE